MICKRCGQEFIPPDKDTVICGSCADDLREEEAAIDDELEAEASAERINREAYEDTLADEHFDGGLDRYWQ